MAKPLLHFAHANGFPSGSYRQLFSLLSRDYSLIAIDRLAHDPDFPVNEGWSNLRDELIHYLERNADAPVIGVGHSMGAVITFLAALERPELFTQIIMLDPPLAVGAGAIAFYLSKKLGFIDKLSPAGRTRNRRQIWRDEEDALAYFRQKGLFNGCNEQTIKDFIVAGTHNCDGGIRLRYSVEAECDTYRTIPHNLGQLAKKIQVPGTLIRGDKSEVTLPRFARIFGQKQALQLGVAKGGHMFPLQHPKLTADLITQTVQTQLDSKAQ